MRPTATRVCAGTLVAAAALAGCSSDRSHRASVATSFGQQLSSSGSASTSPTSTSTATSSSPTTTTAASSPAPPASPGASPTPCPVASPQIFVEGKQAATSGGQVTFSYLDATRICSGDENARYLTTGKTLTTKPVSPSAVILLLAPGGGAAELQVPTPALPAAMASSKVGPSYYTITLDGSGTITRIEQAYLP